MTRNGNSSPQYQSILQQRKFMDRLGNKLGDPIFKDGANAFKAGKTLEDNPFGTHMECFAEGGYSDRLCDRTIWNAGWKAMSEAATMYEMIGVSHG